MTGKRHRGIRGGLAGAPRLSVAAAAAPHMSAALDE